MILLIMLIIVAIASLALIGRGIFLIITDKNEEIKGNNKDQSPIPQEGALIKIRKHDEVIICRYGETLRLCIVESEPTVYGQLYNGMWGIDITEALQTMPHKDFYIKEINNVKVIKP